MKALKFTFVEDDDYRYHKRWNSIYCLVKGIKLAPTDCDVLAFFCMHGVNNETKKLLLKYGYIKSDQQYRNIQSKLYKLNLLVKENKEYKVIDSLNIQGRAAMIIGLDCANQYIVQVEEEV